MISEGVDLISARKAQSDSAVLAVFREMNQKFMAFAAKLPDIVGTSQGFDCRAISNTRTTGTKMAGRSPCKLRERTRIMNSFQYADQTMECKMYSRVGLILQNVQAERMI